MIVLLDAGPLGLATNPKVRTNCDAYDCALWLQGLFQAGAIVCLPEIADYETRRELIRADKDKGLTRLNELKSHAEYLPITTGIMLRAAELWASARNDAIPTASDDSLDADMILVAQAQIRAKTGGPVVIATTDVGDLSRFTDARDWKLIQTT